MGDLLPGPPARTGPLTPAARRAIVYELLRPEIAASVARAVKKTRLEGRAFVDLPDADLLRLDAAVWDGTTE